MNKDELLQKIQALAEKGVGGEKANAEILLKKLCKKYGIEEACLSEEKICRFDISWQSKFERKLVAQVLYQVVGDINEKKYSATYTKKRNKGVLFCTQAEFIEFRARFNFYKYHWKQDLEIFYSAFVKKNSIYPPNDKVKQFKEKLFMSEEDIKIAQMQRGMERHNYNLQIEGGKK